MDRRSFIKICSAAAATGSVAPCLIRQTQAAELASYERVKLVDAQGLPVKASKLVSTSAYLFNYPYASTPNFLINLGKPATDADKLTDANGNAYAWRGGVGADKSIVAYSAICAHQLSYPTKDVSLISYNTGKSQMAGRAGVITCCSHNSVYDPAHGARVLSGPAAGPLSAVALEYDAASDEIYATGVYGGLLFDDFFKAYKSQLNAELGAGKAKEIVTATAQVVPFADYTKTAIQC
jgi:Rieske Fe-S protein